MLARGKAVSAAAAAAAAAAALASAAAALASAAAAAAQWQQSSSCIFQRHGLYSFFEPQDIVKFHDYAFPLQ